MTVASASRPSVRLRGILKRFGDLVANDRVDLDLLRGEVHALLGENGAGKTTLMSILSGILAPDEGIIELDGQQVHFRAPRDALNVGIGMVHQHFRLVDQLTVAENVHMGWRETPRLIRSKELNRRTAELAERFQLGVTPAAKIWQLSVGEQQRVEILRVLARGASIVILDEPTAVLTPLETESLFATIRSLTETGKTVVFVSHKLDEVMTISARVSVMRAGRLLETLPIAECDERKLARLMIGRDVRLAGEDRRGQRQTGPARITLDGVSALNDRGLPALREVSLTLHEGEILGVVGVAGNGQKELSEVLSGLRPLTAGKILIDGKDFSSRSARDFIDAGIGHIPEDRRGTGLVTSESIWRNAILKTYRNAPVGEYHLLRAGIARAFAKNLARKVQLSQEDVDVPVRHLSGGNAQRLLIGREIEATERALIAVHPTQGLDVGAADNARTAILEARAERIPVLFISEDLSELMSLADRLVVMYEGRVVGVFESESADLESIGLLMGGRAA